MAVLFNIVSSRPLVHDDAIKKDVLETGNSHCTFQKCYTTLDRDKYDQKYELIRQCSLQAVGKRFVRVI